jgi:hypothetical protein
MWRFQQASIFVSFSFASRLYAGCDQPASLVFSSISLSRSPHGQAATVPIVYVGAMAVVQYSSSFTRE